MASSNDAHILFFTRMLRHLTNDPYLVARIEWSAELHPYNVYVSTSHGSYAFTLADDGSARQWPPSITLIENAIARFCEVYPELLV